MWYKSAAPRKKTYRLKDAWEPVFHFGSGKDKFVNPFIDHEAIAVPSDAVFTKKTGWSGLNKTTGNIGGYHEIAKQTKGLTDPPNILYYPTALLVKDGNYEHPAKFPVEMIEFLVKGFSPKGGTVCDPFVGSGVTALASLLHDRRCIAMELEPKYCEMTKKRVADYTPPPLPKETEYDIFG